MQITIEDIKAMEMAFSIFDNLLTEHLNDAKYSNNYYINEKKFMDLMGLKKSTFNRMKKLGKFSKAMHPATNGGLRVKYHKYFNRLTNEIELPEQRTDIEKIKIPIEAKKLFLSVFDNLLTNLLTTHFNKAMIDNCYISEKAFIKLMGLQYNRFYELKKQGRFKNAMRLTETGKRAMYHKYFNRFTNKIELPGLDRPIIKRLISKVTHQAKHLNRGDICQ